MSEEFLAVHGVASTTLELPASGGWSVARFVSGSPRVGSDPRVEARTILAHTTQVITDDRWVALHAGSLDAYEVLQPTLWAETAPALRERRQSETEGEGILLWLLSRLDELDGASTHELAETVRGAAAEVSGWAQEAGAASPSLAVVVSDGDRLVATRRRGPLVWSERQDPSPALLVASHAPAGGEWRPALDGMVLAAGPDGRLI